MDDLTVALLGPKQSTTKWKTDSGAVNKTCEFYKRRVSLLPTGLKGPIAPRNSVLITRNANDTLVCVVSPTLPGGKKYFTTTKVVDVLVLYSEPDRGEGHGEWRETTLLEDAFPGEYSDGGVAHSGRPALFVEWLGVPTRELDAHASADAKKWLHNHTSTILDMLPAQMGEGG
jgi:hypothetical protein